MNAGFINMDGYELRKAFNEPYCLIFRKAVYRFALHDPMPIMFRRANGELIQPDRRFFSDMGSIPISLQWAIPKDTYLEPYLFHDSAYLHHGLWFRGVDDLCFSFRALTVWESNALLKEMMLAQGAWSITANAVYGAVQACGWAIWANAERRHMAGSQNEGEE